MSSGPKILHQQVMTGAGQRMPTPQAIILRPGQIGVPGVQVRQPIQVNSTGPRAQGPGFRANCTVTPNRNVVINQGPGSQITVPLHTLQSMQPGQGIPTGQAGHLLVKTETGQYQILRVQSPSTSNALTVASNSPQLVQRVATTAVGVVRTAASTLPAAVTAMANNSAVSAASVASVATPSSTISSAPRPTASPSTTASSSGSGAAAAASAASAAGGSGGGGGAGGMGTQMTPDTAKHKCKNFLATLLRLAGEQPPQVATNVRNLIQGLIDNKVDPETFTTQLQRELNSSPQPCLIPFLRRSLPYLQQSLLNGELSIDGVRAPPRTNTSIIRGVTSTIQRPPIIGTASGVQRPLIRTITTLAGGSASTSQVGLNIRGLTPRVNTPGIQNTFIKGTGTVAGLQQRVGALNNLSTPSSVISNQQVREKKSSNSYSVTGDEDINDVAAMGGVNLAEESQRMQGTIVTGTQIRSCKDETFLQTGLLHKRIARLCREQGLDEPCSDVIALVSHATQDRLKTLLEKLSVISEHRLDIVRQEGDYEVTQDVRGQLRFLGELDKIERKRHEEAERELLYRAMKSRTKNEDQEKLKAKGKELQRLEEEQQRYEQANTTAIAAIGGPRKMLKLDGPAISSASGGLGSSLSTSSRPRMKRVHVRDLVFLMEQEKDLKRSPLLWKAYCS